MKKRQRTKLSKVQVRHIAKLARLGLTSKEVNKFQQQLSSILDFVGKLNQVDTNKVEPTSQVTGLENVFREDVVTTSLSQKQALSNASQSYNGYFKVKAVLKT